MKHKLKISHENGMYIGYALVDGKVTFQTNPCKDSISCSRALSQYAAKQTPLTSQHSSPKPNRIVPTVTQKITNPVIPPSARPSKPVSSSPKRCCGRG